MRTRWLLVSAVFAGLLAFFNAYGISHNLYVSGSWYDFPMHILGGLTVASFGMGVVGYYSPKLFWGSLIAIAIGWEFFEYVTRLSTSQPHFWVDTLHDLVNDMTGGVIIWKYSRHGL
jgi:hypothetical protein